MDEDQEPILAPVLSTAMLEHKNMARGVVGVETNFEAELGTM